MNRVDRISLLQAGFCRRGSFYHKGKLSVYQHEDGGEFYLNHEYPFDFMLTGMEQLEALDRLLQSEHLHISDPAEEMVFH